MSVENGKGNVTSLLEQKIDWVKPIDLGQYQNAKPNLFLNSILRDWVDQLIETRLSFCNMQ